MKNLVFILFLLSFSISSAQQETFVKTLSNDSLDVVPEGLTKGIDGDYFISGKLGPLIGDLFIIKFDQNNDTLFSTIINDFWYYPYHLNYSRTLTATFDGGCAVIGSDNGGGVFFLKLDNSGNITIQKNYGSSYLLALSKIAQTRDSGFVILYHDNIISPTNGYAFNQLIKTDKNGDTLWYRDFGPGGGMCDVVENETGDLYVINNNFRLTKLDSNGDDIWYNVFSNQILNEIVGLRDNFIFVRTETNNTPDSTFIYKIDTNGTFIEAYYLPQHEILDADFTITNEMLILTNQGTTKSVLKLDSNLQILSYTSLNSTTEFNRIIEGGNKSIIISGANDNGVNLRTGSVSNIDSLGNNFCMGGSGIATIEIYNRNSNLTIGIYPGQNRYFFTSCNYTFTEYHGIGISLDCISNKIETIKEEDQFTIFPNPSNGFSFIKSTDKTNRSVSIFNLSGQCLLNESNISFPYPLELEKYGKGLYFIKLYNENEFKVLKSIVE